MPKFGNQPLPEGEHSSVQTVWQLFRRFKNKLGFGNCHPPPDTQQPSVWGWKNSSTYERQHIPIRCTCCCIFG